MGAILVVVLIIDLFIFRYVTDRPLGLAPSDLSSGPNINVNAQAAPVGADKVTPGEPFILVPSMSFQEVQNNSAEGVNVIGYGRTENSLYLQVRLRESIDLSLKKGWGKAFQLIDSQGHSYLYDSYSLPSGVHLYDPLVDLPDDLRANQTILENGYKDLYLCFPKFPAKSVPVQLRVIEAYQGDSPANPGITYHDISFAATGSPQSIEAVTALDSLRLDLKTLPPLSLNNEVEIVLQTLWIDEQLFPRLTLNISHQTSDVYLLDSLLIDESGHNYSMLQLQDVIALESNQEEIQLVYERLPNTADIKQVWLKFSVGNTEYELIAEI